ncbi:MAG: GldM family protein [Flavobacterium sp.]
MRKLGIIHLLLISQIFLISCSRKITFEYYSKDKGVLYLNNIPNEFYIKSENPGKLKVEITQASIERKNDTTFVIKTDNERFSQMTISDDKGSRKVYFKKSYVPKPELRFQGRDYYTTKVMKISEARSIGQFSSTIQNFSYDLAFLDSTLEIIRIDSSNKVTTEKVSKDKDRRFSLLRRAEVGDTYIFHNIKIEVSKGEIIDGQDLVITIVE